MIGVTLAVFAALLSAVVLQGVPLFVGLTLALCLSAMVCVLYLLYVRDGKVLPSGICLIVQKEREGNIASSLGALVFYVLLAALTYRFAPALLVPVAASAVFAIAVLIAALLYGSASLERLAAVLFVMPVAICCLLTGGVFGAGMPGTQLSGALQLLIVLSVGGFVLAIGGAFALRRLRRQAAATISPDVLARALESDKASDRAVALEYLMRAPSAQLVDAVVRATRDENVAVAYAARQVLAGIWGQAPAVSLRLPAGVPLEDVMQKVPGDVAEMLADELYVSEKADARYQRLVEDTLCESVKKDGRILEQLIVLGDDAEQAPAAARRVSIELLGATRDARAYASLLKHLLAADQEESEAAMVGFRGADTSALVFMETLFDDASAWVRKRAIEATYQLLARLHERNAGEAQEAHRHLARSLDTLLTHRDPVTRSRALCLLDPSDARSVEVLERCCADPYGLVRGEALMLLASFSAERARAHVLVALHDQRAHVRLSAISCAVALRMTETVDEFQVLTADRDITVAQAAYWAISNARSWTEQLAL